MARMSRTRAEATRATSDPIGTKLVALELVRVVLHARARIVARWLDEGGALAQCSDDHLELRRAQLERDYASSVGWF